MIIDKTINFATPAEREQAGEYKARYEKLIDELKQYAGDTEQEQEQLTEEIKQNIISDEQVETDLEKWAESFTETQADVLALYDVWATRYIESFNGNIAAILADAREVAAAITKQDYLNDFNMKYRGRCRKLERLDPGNSEAEELQILTSIGFSSCYRFLLDTLIMQINAIIKHSGKDKAQNLDLIAEIAANKALELYPEKETGGRKLEYRAMPIEDEPTAPPKRRPRTTKAERLALIASDDLSKRLINYPYLNIPTSPAVESVLHLMNTGGNLSRLEERRPQICHGQTIRTLVKTDGGHEVRVITTTGVSTVTLEVKALDKLLHSPTARKMFIYTLKKLNDQAFSGGEFKQNYAVFTLQELIDIGYYSTEQSARKGFKNAMEVLTSIKVSGELHKGKKNVLSSEHLTVLYTGYELLGNGTYAFYVNERVNWAMVCAFYTSLPRFYFELSARASTLLYFIAVQARRETKTIAERHYLTISMRAVQERLNLPDEKGNTDPQRTIKKPVIDAIAEINQHAASKGIGLSLELIGSTSRTISDFMENAYIKATLSGEYAESFTTIASSQQKQIETAEKRREALTQKIIAERAAKKIDAAADQSAGTPPKRKRGRPPKSK